MIVGSVIILTDDENLGDWTVEIPSITEIETKLAELREADIWVKEAQAALISSENVYDRLSRELGLLLHRSGWPVHVRQRDPLDLNASYILDLDEVTP